MVMGITEAHTPGNRALTSKKRKMALALLFADYGFSWGRMKVGVSEGIRTLDLQGHNLAP